MLYKRSKKMEVIRHENTYKEVCDCIDDMIATILKNVSKWIN